MTDLKLMESKEPTYEVVSRPSSVSVSSGVTCEAFDNGNAEWRIGITDELTDHRVALTAAEAQAIAEFIRVNVRKRW